MPNHILDPAEAWELTESICEIIDDEMAHSATGEWTWAGVRSKVVARIGLTRCPDVDHAIRDALECQPVGTNVLEDGSIPEVIPFGRPSGPSQGGW